jgi:hypothetical protein
MKFFKSLDAYWHVAVIVLVYAFIIKPHTDTFNVWLELVALTSYFACVSLYVDYFIVARHFRVEMHEYIYENPDELKNWSAMDAVAVEVEAKHSDKCLANISVHREGYEPYERKV